MADKPMFIKVSEYEDIQDMVNLIRSKIEESRKILATIDQLKKQEETEIAAWRAEIEEVDRKVGYINKTLFESGQQ